MVDAARLPGPNAAMLELQRTINDDPDKRGTLAGKFIGEMPNDRKALGKIRNTSFTRFIEELVKEKAKDLTKFFSCAPQVLTYALNGLSPQSVHRLGEISKAFKVSEGFLGGFEIVAACRKFNEDQEMAYSQKVAGVFDATVKLAKMFFTHKILPRSEKADEFLGVVQGIAGTVICMNLAIKDQRAVRLPNYPSDDWIRKVDDTLRVGKFISIAKAVSGLALSVLSLVGQVFKVLLSPHLMLSLNTVGAVCGIFGASLEQHARIMVAGQIRAA